MGYDISENFNVKKAWTFDERSMRKSYDDLLLFTELNFITNGFPVSVFDSDPEKRGLYQCVNENDLSNPASWERIGAIPVNPESRVWFVQDAGQLNDGTGTSADPFKSVNIAINAASSGDSILWLPGSVNGATGKPEYSLPVSVTKNLTITALGEVIQSGEFAIGAFPQSGDALNVNVTGVTFTGRVVVIKQLGQTVPHNIAFRNCYVSGNGYFEHYGILTNLAFNDEILFVNLRGKNTKSAVLAPSLGNSLFVFNENSSLGQGCNITLEDCKPETLHNALFGGFASMSSRITLTGFTRLFKPSARGIQEVGRTNSSGLATDAQIIIDKREISDDLPFIPIPANYQNAGNPHFTDLNTTLLWLIARTASGSSETFLYLDDNGDIYTDTDGTQYTHASLQTVPEITTVNMTDSFVIESGNTIRLIEISDAINALNLETE